MEPTADTAGWSPGAVTGAERQAVEALLRRLRRSSPVRQLGAAVLAGECPTPSGIELLEATVRSVSGARWRERVAAAWALGRAPLPDDLRPPAGDALIGGLSDTSAADVSGRVSRWLWRTAAVASALMALLWTTGTTVAGDWSETILVWAGMGLLLGVPLFPFSVVAVSLQKNRARAAAATALGHLRIAESVDALAAMTEQAGRSVGSIELRRAVAGALKEVLPTVREDQYQALDRATVPRLCRLVWSSDLELALASLGALERAGDGRAVEPLERLVRVRASGVLHEAAERSLPVLRARRQQERDASRLLRPSGAVPADETLLRPAAGAEPTSAAQLVRPATRAPE